MATVGIAATAFALGVGAALVAARIAGAGSRASDAHAPAPPGRQAGARRACGSGILTAAAVVVLEHRFGRTPTFVAYGALAVGLVTLGEVDLRCRRLPTSALRATAAVMLGGMVAASADDGRWAALVVATVCGGVAWLTFSLVRGVVGRRGGVMGRGDVRLAGLVGTAAAWSGPPRAAPLLMAVALLSGCLSACCVGVVRIWRGRPRSDRFAFGPWLAVGAMLVVVAGPVLLRPLGGP